jgi:hypothetical protein
MTHDLGAFGSTPRHTRRALFAMVLAITAFVLPNAVAAPAHAVTISQLNTWVNTHDDAHTCFQNSYGVQCVALINAYADFAGATAIGGNAKDFYNNAGSGWIKYPLGSHTPVKGDVVVYGNT